MEVHSIWLLAFAAGICFYLAVRALEKAVTDAGSNPSTHPKGVETEEVGLND